MTSELKGASPAAFGSLGEEDQDYFTYIINQLKEKKILLQKSIDKTDEVYQEWQSGTISAQEYLNHAIAQNWIDITQFTIDEKYSDSTEIYDALCDYIMDDIATDTGFSKIIYEYLIKAGFRETVVSDLIRSGSTCLRCRGDQFPGIECSQSGQLFKG